MLNINKYSEICGIDEAGRGALAGPLVACAVIVDRKKNNNLNNYFSIPLKDSKLLSKSERKIIYRELLQANIKYILDIIPVRIINNSGIGKANIRIIRNLIKKTNAPVYIVDGKFNIGRFKKHKNVFTEINADCIYGPTILAGIVSKVKRDEIMEKLNTKHKHYYWYNNAGYGTKKHIQNIIKFGSTKHHRNIFVSTALSNYQFKNVDNNTI